MDESHFDHLVKSLTSPSRRGVFSALTATLVGAALTPAADPAGTEAKRDKRKARNAATGALQASGKKKKKKKKKKAPTATSPTVTSPPTGGTRPPSCPQTCAGCCAGESCQPGTSTTACGANGAPCSVCSGLQGSCFNGACRCDVCAGGCQYPTVQAAVADPNGPGTIRVCAGPYNENVTIDRDVTLLGAGDGTGAGDTVLAGTGSSSVVTINPGLAVTLQRLRITGGHGSAGGGIYTTASTVTLLQCTVTGNTASTEGGGAGGGIFTDGGFLTLDASHVTNNSAARSGGGIANTSSAGRARVTLQNGSTVTGNSARNGGGIRNITDCTVTLHSGSSVSGNTADPAGGGGILNDGTLTLIDSDITNNTATLDGGGVYNEQNGRVTLLHESSITGNTSHDPVPSGGGIFNFMGFVNPIDGTITGNTPDQCSNVSGGTGCPA